MNERPIVAWFESAKGPEDLPGVRLAYIEPTYIHFERALEAANKAMDTPRALNILHQKSFYEQKGQKYFTPDFGWWMKEGDYYSGREGFGGVTRKLVETEHPNILIMSSRKRAIDYAKKKGLLDAPLVSQDPNAV